MNDELVREEPKRGRFELQVGTETAYADYGRKPGAIIVHYVYAPPVLRGTGVAGRLMAGIAATARQEGSRIEPRCHYAAMWLQASKEYRDLIA